MHCPAQHRGVIMEGWVIPQLFLHVQFLFQEPVPGWADNLNGPTGLFLIAGIGVMRTAVVIEEVGEQSRNTG